MNKEDAVDYLRKLLGDIILSDEFTNELIDLISKSGNEKVIVRLFITRLKFLAQAGVTATKAKEYELIGKGIFSMHVSGSGFNIRILYAFDENSVPILLHAFTEKRGNRKTEYPVHISMAQDRIEKIKKEREK